VSERVSEQARKQVIYVQHNNQTGATMHNQSNRNSAVLWVQDMKT